MNLIGRKRKIRSGRQTAMYVSRVSIAINLVLSAFKLFAGVAAHSGAMISDGIHTASDVLSTLIVMAGVAMAIPILAPAIPTRAPTEERASER